MKICLIGTLPDANREAHKGPERTVIGLAEALDERGHDVLVVSDEGDAETVGTPAEVIGEDLNPGVDRLLRFYHRVQHEINLDTFDVVHSWRPAPDVDIFSIHSINAAETVEQRQPGTFSRRYRLGAKIEMLGKRFTSSNADRSIVTAIQNVIDATNNGIEPDRVIPVGVEDSFLQRSESAGEQVQVLCVGRIEQRKNQAFLAAHTPKTYDLRLVGPSNDEYAKVIPKFEERWEGKLPAEELRRSYRTADVFVLPSIFEGFGLTAAEAMAAETPVVVADTCGIADHIYDEPIGEVYQYGDPDSYRRQLERVVERRDEYGRNAHKYVRKNLIWDAIVDQYEREYDRISKGKTENDDVDPCKIV